jgi:uncharacterized protein (TIGR04255 family)
MIPRPTDLPNFTDPPVTEVVLGVQFASLDGLLAAHLGGVWDLFRDEFAGLEEHPPLPPAFETFGQNPGGGITMSLQAMATPDLPRTFFVNDDRTRLIQIQRDRFIHNWRKVGVGDSYPRFESILETFGDRFRRFSSHVAEQGFGRVEPNQCEVSYINHIPVASADTAFDAANVLFDGFVPHAALPDLERPEDGRFLLRYIMRREDGSPGGRLVVNCEPARRTDGTHIIQFILTARGVPVHPTIDAVEDFLAEGRVCIVRGFKALTSSAMHKKWGMTE